MHPGVVYTAARLGVFVLVAALLYAVGFRSWMLALGALLISAPLSYYVLRRQREAFAAQVEGRVSARQAEKARLRATLRGDDEA
jgi:cytochrome c-type biogenesis protein CcmH/NrfF